ncbi:multidrug resistance [Fusarium agapanthi]|uniref:Multidrug resistance n=1 Tax=Fusarium agapanthi TaxID=1803897 RepID=A0A9P5E6H5_9HYPO|nr:multidrug resistance [Fusarium agapanthi]
MTVATQLQPPTSSASSTIANATDVESQQINAKTSHFNPIIDQVGLTDAVLNHGYPGHGTEDSPYLVEFLPNDSRNALNFSRSKRWLITILQAIATLAVTFANSILCLFHGLDRVQCGCRRCPDHGGLDSPSFLAGSFGSSPLSNAGGVIADMFEARDRGLATALFAMAPFLGPTIGSRYREEDADYSKTGPITGGFLGESEGWRWVMGMTSIFTGVVWIINSLVIPETYAPYLLRRRVAVLSKRTGKVYISKTDVGRPRTTIATQFKTAMLRPWVLLIKEPIVLLTSLYMAIVYGTLYLCFAAFPIVFQQGMLFAVTGTILDNKRYARAAEAAGGHAPPETRLPPSLVGSILIPVGLFWFAWTNGKDVHWIVSIIGSAFFACGLVSGFLSLLNYLIDSYSTFAASVLAANSILRSLFGAVFPLFTTYMYNDLGIHWASSIPAFLAVACVPFPFLFYNYGKTIRMKCEYAAEAANVLQKMRTKHEVITEDQAAEEVREAELERRASNALRRTSKSIQ